MHFQDKPMNDYKIVICLEVKFMMLLLTLKKDQILFKTLCFYTRWKKKDCLFIPKGYAHGYQTLT